MLARAIHGVEYDDIHDEMVLPQPFSQAILTFRGGANGDEAPIRVIQGPLTGIYNYTDQVAIDPVHDEIYVPTGYPTNDRILVFAREANGNVAPIRVLQGPNAFRGLVGLGGVAVDPVRNLLLVSGEAMDGTRGVMMFDRTAQGNVKPLRTVIGPTGRMRVSPEKGLFLVVIKPPRGESERDTGLEAPGDMAAESDKDYVGVWSVDDTGEVPPRWMIGGPQGILKWIFGMALNPKEKTVVVTDMRLNGVVTYSFPEIF